MSLSDDVKMENYIELKSQKQSKKINAEKLPHPKKQAQTLHTIRSHKHYQMMSVQELTIFLKTFKQSILDIHKTNCSDLQKLESQKNTFDNLIYSVTKQFNAQISKIHLKVHELFLQRNQVLKQRMMLQQRERTNIANLLLQQSKQLKSDSDQIKSELIERVKKLETSFNYLLTKQQNQNIIASQNKQFQKSLQNDKNSQRSRQKSSHQIIRSQIKQLSFVSDRLNDVLNTTKSKIKQICQSYKLLTEEGLCANKQQLESIRQWSKQDSVFMNINQNLF